jgi:predicted phosphodiesterase
MDHSAGTLKINIPESYASKRLHYVMPQSVTRLGILNDIHLPYHDVASLEIALNKLLDDKINGLLLNGDIFDFHTLSKFEKDPRKRHFSEELETGKQFMDLLVSLFNCPIYFKKGNHEERYEHYMKQKAPELYGIAEYRLENLLELGAKRIQTIEDKVLIKAGGLSIFHGHELNMKSISVNPARTLFLKAKVSSMCGHLHAVSAHSARRADGHVIGCWSIGHLGEESPDYAAYNEWQQGFAMIEINGKEFEVSNYKIINGRAYRS